jgi:hypothetical protein
MDEHKGPQTRKLYVEVRFSCYLNSQFFCEANLFAKWLVLLMLSGLSIVVKRKTES